MLISIIILSYNRANYIGEALDALYHQTAPLDQFEVLVIDNNSTDGTPEVFAQWRVSHPNGQFYYQTETKQGASYARNTGSTLAIGAWLCFIDDDAVSANNFVENIHRHIQAYPDRVGFGGRIIPRYIPSEPKWMSYYVSSMVGNFDYAPVACAFKDGKYPLESNMVVNKKIFDLIGGFNTMLPGVVGTLRIGGEGKDLFYKIMALGNSIYYDPSIIVEHVVEVKKLTKEYLYRVASGIGRGERSRTKAISQWAYISKIIEYLFKFAAAIVLGIKYALQGNPAKTGPIIQFRIDALLGLIGR
jgi:glycosyltransferase involved in cell wall biosynthesis